MTKTANSIRPTTTRLSKLSITVTATISAAGLFAIVLIVLVLWHASPSLPAVRADSAASAEHKLQQAEHAAASNSRTVRLTEDEVNSVLHDLLQKGGRLVAPNVDGLHDFRVRLIGNQIEAFIVLGRRGTEVTVDLEGKLYSQEGRLQFDPIAGRIGELRLPQGILISAMRQALSGPEERQRLRLPPDITDLQVENSQVLLRYY
jgi:hypothetical protein